MAVNNSILLKLSDQEMKELNDGWFAYVYANGKNVSRSEYIRIALNFMNRSVRDLSIGIKQIKGEKQ